MSTPLFVSGIDIAELSLWAFTLFFIGLIIYLRREDRREGYPLEEDTTGREESTAGFLFFPQPKRFKMANGEVIVAPENKREKPSINARRLAVWPGAPIEPVGDPFAAGVGPGAYANRSNRTDLTTHGTNKIAPLRTLPDYALSAKDHDPRGWPMYGVDNRVAGTVRDVWIDRGEQLIRYLEVELGEASGAAAGRRVLLPMTMAVIAGGLRRRVTTDSVTAAQFAGAPSLENPDQITFYEEERVTAYFGAGYLYASKGRSEPLL